jgi:hypothetical protein
MQLNGLSLAITNVLGGRLNPLSWFAAGEQGAWYDPSDLTTLFQDSAGTTPVTAVEQPVGLMLDKSKGLALGAELVTNGDFSNGTTGWNSGNGSSLSNTSNALIITGAAGYGYGYQSLTLEVGKTYKISWNIVATSSTPTYLQVSTTIGGANMLNKVNDGTGYMSAIFTATAIVVYANFLTASPTSSVLTIDNISVKQIAGNHAFQATAGNRPLLSARTNILLATATLATQSVTSLATNYALSFTGAGTVTLSGTATGVLSAGTNTFTATAGTLTLTVSGSVTLADLRPTNSGALLPPYQRVNTASDYDTVGFPLYLKANGTSSAMSTNSIDFSSTDKMTVVTGVRKLSDATRGMIGELSSSLDTNNGSFNISGSFPNATANYRYESKGTLVSSADCGTGYIAPINNVLTTQSYIATDSDSMRVNGTLVATSPADQGAGNFGNYPFYLFARAGTSLFLNGQFYGAIIRGAQSDTASITQTENYMATKTGITF